MPLLNIYASSDHLVPPSSTKPLNDLVGSVDKSLYEFKGGHIGVFVGSKSQKELAPNISKWLHDRSLCDEPGPSANAAPARGAAPAEGPAAQLGVAAGMTETAGAAGATVHKAEGLEHTAEVVAEVAEKKAKGASVKKAEIKAAPAQAYPAPRAKAVKPKIEEPPR